MRINKNIIIIIVVAAVAVGGFVLFAALTGERDHTQEIPIIDEEELAEEPLATEDGTPYCFSHVDIMRDADIRTWPDHRNYAMGYELRRPSGMQIARDIEQEARGREVFRITSDRYASGAHLRVYDLRAAEYAMEPGDGSVVAYDVADNTWQKDGVECYANEAGYTGGGWEIYAAVLDDADTVNRSYVTIHHPHAEEVQDRFPVALEFSVRADRGAMDEVWRDNFDMFMDQLETVVRSTRFFVPQ